MHFRTANPELRNTQFSNGFVFDSRVVAPLSDLPPAQFGDSSAFGMQHMAVVRDVAY